MERSQRSGRGSILDRTESRQLDGDLKNLTGSQSDTQSQQDKTQDHNESSHPGSISSKHQMLLRLLPVQSYKIIYRQLEFENK